MCGYARVVPRVSAFFGIVIFMYWEEADHHRPHFHAEHGDHRASVAFDGTVLGGDLPPRAPRFVREWATLHQSVLAAIWDRARTQQPLQRIDPLA